MKILVLSDSHGSVDRLCEIIRTNSTAEVVAFCGDGHNDIQSARQMFPDRMFLTVRGNCDWCCEDAFLQEVKFNGRKIIITHGHLYGVKEGYHRIEDYARSVNADVVLFGHTHNQYLDYNGRSVLMNPGSASRHKDYGIVEIDDNGKITASVYPQSKYNPPIVVG